LTQLPQSLGELQAVFDRWTQSMQKIRGRNERIAFTRTEMPALLLNRRLLKKIITDIVKGKHYPDIRQATMFSNEFILYINNRRLYSVRLYIYEPGQYTPVHDHNSWGVYGCVSKKVEVIRFRRQDDETRQGYARLRETDRIMLRPGDTSVVLPLNDGIHQAGNPATGTCVMLSVYGTPIRRLYVNQYDPTRNRVSRRYPPRLRKKRLATQALETMGVDYL
jgi:predicted metal-dependent enzyme (double-stranded beta helix superfamily)